MKPASWPIDTLIASDVDTINDGFTSNGYRLSFRPNKIRDTGSAKAVKPRSDVLSMCRQRALCNLCSD